MTPEISSAIAAVVASMIWWTQLSRWRRNLGHPIGTFGERKQAGLSQAEREMLLAEYVRQLRWAFGLVWFAVAIGVILGTSLVARFVFARHLDGQDIAEIVALAGDITVGTGAFRLYNSASKELYNILKMLH